MIPLRGVYTLNQHCSQALQAAWKDSIVGNAINALNSYCRDASGRIGSSDVVREECLPSTKAVFRHSSGITAGTAVRDFLA
jgi:hypothetical protein